MVNGEMPVAEAESGTAASADVADCCLVLASQPLLDSLPLLPLPLVYL